MTVGELIEALSKFDPDAMVVAHRGSMGDRDFPEPEIYELSDWEKRKNIVYQVWTGDKFADIPEGSVFL